VGADACLEAFGTRRSTSVTFHPTAPRRGVPSPRRYSRPWLHRNRDRRQRDVRVETSSHQAASWPRSCTRAAGWRAKYSLKTSPSASPEWECGTADRRTSCGFAWIRCGAGDRRGL